MNAFFGQKKHFKSPENVLTVTLCQLFPFFYFYLNDYKVEELLSPPCETTSTFELSIRPFEQSLFLFFFGGGL